MNQPIISVVTAVHNGEKFIASSLISLLVQSFKDFELIVIDDGSTDRSVEIIKSLKDPRIKLYQQEKNLGLTKSLNRAISMAKGRYIARHDADDYSMFHRLETQLRFLEKHPEVMLLGSSVYVTNNRNIINEVLLYPSTDEQIKNSIVHFNPFVHGSMIFEKKFILQNGGYNEEYRYVQDYELWGRILPTALAFNISDPLYIRIRHEKSSEKVIDKSNIAKKIQKKLLAKEEFNSILKEDIMKKIEPVGFYPLVSYPFKYGKKLGKQFYLMSKEAKKHKLPWSEELVKSFFYCPLHFI